METRSALTAPGLRAGGTRVVRGPGPAVWIIRRWSGSCRNRHETTDVKLPGGPRETVRGGRRDESWRQRMTERADETIKAVRSGRDDLAALVRDFAPGDLARPSGAAKWDVSQELRP